MIIYDIFFIYEHNFVSQIKIIIANLPFFNIMKLIMAIKFVKRFHLSWFNSKDSILSQSNPTQKKISRDIRKDIENKDEMKSKNILN